MREIRTSGLMSGEGKRVASVIPRLSSTLLLYQPAERLTRASLPTRHGPARPYQMHTSRWWLEKIRRASSQSGLSRSKRALRYITEMKRHVGLNSLK